MMVRSRVALTLWLIGVLTGCGPMGGAPDGDAAPSDARALGDGLVPSDGAADASQRTFYDGSGQWPCPAEWVPYQRGGCAPAVLACAPGGGAAPGACDAIDLTHSRPVPLADGGTGGTFALGADGGVTGAWVDDAGIPSCPAGWSRQSDGTCDPALRADCPAGTGALPGGGCTATGEADCPATPFADPGAEAAGAAVVHVLAGANASLADGSAVHPYASLTAALALAPTGAWVLVGAGAYAEALTVTSAVHVVGQCAAHVTLSAPAGSTATLTLSGSGARLDLRGVAVTGAALGVHGTGGASLRVRASRFTGVRDDGVLLEGPGATLDGADLLVVDTHGTDAPLGGGVMLAGGAGGTLARIHVARADNRGVVVRDAGGTLALTDSVVRDTRLRSDNTGGGGLGAVLGAQLSAERVVLLGNASGALAVDAAGSGSGAARLVLTDALVRESFAAPDGTHGFGLVVDGGRIVATRVLLDRNVDGGAACLETGGAIDLLDSVVRDTTPAANGHYGQGVWAIGACAMTVTRTRLTGNATGAVYAHGAGASAVVTESVVEVPAGLPRGPALWVDQGGALSATRVWATGGATAVAGAFGAMSTLRIEDSFVAGAMPDAQGVGPGLRAALGGRLLAARVLAEDSAGIGALASGAGQLTLTDVLVRRVAQGSNSNIGLGVVSLDDGSVALTRVAVVDVFGMGLGAATIDTTLATNGGHITGDDVLVLRVRESTFPVVTTHHALGTLRAGTGIGSGLRSDVRLSRAVIADGQQGLYSLGGRITLNDVVLTGQQQAGVLTAGGTLEAINLRASGNADDAVVTSGQ